MVFKFYQTTSIKNNQDEITLPMVVNNVWSPKISRFAEVSTAAVVDTDSGSQMFSLDTSFMNHQTE